MNVSIIKIEGANDLARERLVLQVTKDTDLGNYAILIGERVSVDTVASGPIPAAFWFEALPVRAGDYVMVYSKAGDLSKKDIGNGHTSHFFYWGWGKSIWHHDKIPVLLEAPNWQFLTEEEFTLEPPADSGESVPKAG